jgi:hypothetical protein
MLWEPIYVSRKLLARSIKGVRTQLCYVSGGFINRNLLKPFVISSAGEQQSQLKSLAGYSELRNGNINDLGKPPP